MVKLLTEPWGRKMHSDYYNMVFGEKLANILYEANSQFFYERNVIEEAVNALFCEREIINNKNIIIFFPVPGGIAAKPRRVSNFIKLRMVLF